MNCLSFIGEELELFDYVEPICDLGVFGIKQKCKGGYIEDILYVNGMSFLTLLDEEDNVVCEDVNSMFFIRDLNKKNDKDVVNQIEKLTLK